MGTAADGFNATFEACAEICENHNFSHFGLECPMADRTHCQCQDGDNLGNRIQDVLCSGGLVHKASCDNTAVLVYNGNEYYLGANSRGSVYKISGSRRRRKLTTTSTLRPPPSPPPLNPSYETIAATRRRLTPRSEMSLGASVSRRLEAMPSIEQERMADMFASAQGGDGAAATAFRAYMRRLSEGSSDLEAQGAVRIAVAFNYDPPPTGEHELVTVKPQALGGLMLIDAQGNAMTVETVDADVLSADKTNEPAAAAAPAAEIFSLCGDTNSTMAFGELLPPLLALTHGLLRTAGPLLPYASAAMALRAEAAKRRKAGLAAIPKGRRTTPRWGPIMWLMCLVLPPFTRTAAVPAGVHSGRLPLRTTLSLTPRPVSHAPHHPLPMRQMLSLTLLPQVALGFMQLPWGVAIGPLWLLELATVGWLLRLKLRDRKKTQTAPKELTEPLAAETKELDWQEKIQKQLKDAEAGHAELAKAPPLQRARWLSVVCALCDLLLHASVALVVDGLVPVPYVVAGVAAVQLIVSIANTAKEAKQRARLGGSRCGAQARHAVSSP